MLYQQKDGTLNHMIKENGMSIGLLNYTAPYLRQGNVKYHISNTTKGNLVWAEFPEASIRCDKLLLAQKKVKEVLEAIPCQI